MKSTNSCDRTAVGLASVRRRSHWLRLRPGGFFCAPASFGFLQESLQMGLEALEIFKEVGGWPVLSKASNCFELAKLEVFGKASTVLLRLLQFSWIISVAPLPRSGRLLSVGQQAATSVSPAMLQAVDFDLSGDAKAGWILGWQSWPEILRSFVGCYSMPSFHILTPMAISRDGMMINKGWILAATHSIFRQAQGLQKSWDAGNKAAPVECTHQVLRQGLCWQEWPRGSDGSVDWGGYEPTSFVDPFTNQD